MEKAKTKTAGKVIHMNPEQEMLTIEKYLAKRYDFRLNEVLSRLEYKTKHESNYKLLNDYDLNSMYCELKNDKYKLGVDRLIRILHSKYVDKYNPFTEYFNSLDEWDGKDYITKLSDSVKTHDNEFWKDALTHWLVGMVKSAIFDETINHQVIVLCGEQGIGKSTFIEKLLPKQLRSYVYSGTINPSNRDTLVLMSEKIIIDLDELANLNRKEEKALKELITKRTVQLRKAYGKFNENLTRRASFIGSVNDSQFLTDLTGNRRYLCFRVESFTKDFKVNYEGLYAQVMHLIKENYKHWYEGDEITKINENNEQFRIKTPLEELIEKYYLSTNDINEAENFLNATEILNELRMVHGIQLNNTNQIFLGKVMKRLGFEQFKKEGIYRYGLIKRDL